MPHTRPQRRGLFVNDAVMAGILRKMGQDLLEMAEQVSTRSVPLTQREQEQVLKAVSSGLADMSAELMVHQTFKSGMAS